MQKNEFDLNDFGIYEGISETIATTTKGWTPNAAPIGIIRKKNKVFIRLFKGSTTYENVVSSKMLVANICNDPLIFALSTFVNLDDEYFESISFDGLTISSLKEAQSWILFECVNTKLTSEAFVAELIPKRAHINKCIIKAPNRAFFSVIEACVHATRHKLTGDQKYLKLIKAYGDVVEKCGGDAEKEAMHIIYECL